MAYPDWLVVDERNERAVRGATALIAALPDDWAAEGFRIAIGGDGLLLRTVAAHDFKGTWMGLNAGHLGFLHNDVDDVHRVATQLVEGRWKATSFPLLEARVDLRDGGERTGFAMNDVYLERATGQAARLSLSVDGYPVVENLVADGLIVATALGSTAYSFSAGGVPAHPLLKVLKVTPICPHLPRLSAFDLPGDVRVRIDVLQEERRPVRAVVDGQALAEVRAVDVALSDRTVDLAYLEGHDFTAHLLRKIVIP